MKKLFLLLFLFFSFGFSLGKEHIRVTIMKSGSGLIDNTLVLLCDFNTSPKNLELFLENMNINLEVDDLSNFTIPKNIRLSTHLWNRDYNWIKKIMVQNNDIFTIINIRDPRDVCLSLVNFFNEMQYERRVNYTKYVPKNWDSLSFDEKLSFCISKDSTLYDQFFNALDLETKSNTLLVRFENLVGSKGGGSDALQQLEVKKIANFLAIDLTEKEIDDICKKIFGHGWTFRKGQIGKYKEIFQEHHYEAFEERFADLIEPLSKWYDFSR